MQIENPCVTDDKPLQGNQVSLQKDKIEASWKNNQFPLHFPVRRLGKAVRGQVTNKNSL